MFNYNRIKKRTYEIIERGSNGDKFSRIFDYSIMVLIILNVASILLESFDGISGAFGSYFEVLEIFSVIVFTIEYLLRLWTANLKFPTHKGFAAIARQMSSPMAVIDFLAIFPTYIIILAGGLSGSFMFLRILRLTRLLRIFKLTRYSNALNLVGKVIKDKKEELTITFFITFLLVLMASTIMYYVEHEVNAEAFPNIGAAIWWAIATLTTIGYGDVYPATGLGRFLSGVIALLGIGLVAMPTGIISSSFMEELNSRNKKAEKIEPPCYCPHCGKKIRE